MTTSTITGFLSPPAYSGGTDDLSSGTTVTPDAAKAGAAALAKCPPATAPKHQTFWASNPALTSASGIVAPPASSGGSSSAPPAAAPTSTSIRGVSSSLSVPIPDNATSYRVTLGPAQPDSGNGLPFYLRPPVNPTGDPFAAFAARPLGLMEDAAGDIITGASATFDLGGNMGTGNMLATVALPRPRSLRLTVVWGSDGDAVPAGVLRVPVYIDFQ